MSFLRRGLSNVGEPVLAQTRVQNRCSGGAREGVFVLSCCLSKLYEKWSLYEAQNGDD